MNLQSLHSQNLQTIDLLVVSISPSNIRWQPTTQPDYKPGMLECRRFMSSLLS